MNNTQRLFSLIIILVVVTFFIVAANAISEPAPVCECECATSTPVMVLPDDTPSVQEWLQWMD